MQPIEQLQQWIDQSESIVFFGGAGVSTESGIPDFRSVDGLYHQKYRYPPEQIISRSFYDTRTVEFYEFYRDRMLFPDAKPNAAHKKLAALEQAGKLKAVVTQNIDGLHQMAGSQNVLELHGSVHRNYCCSCGGEIKPDVVLYEESLDGATMRAAVEAIASADMLIIGGTSLVVYPAAGMVNYYKGDRLVLINKGSTSYDSRADLFLQGKIGEILEQIKV